MNLISMSDCIEEKSQTKIKNLSFQDVQKKRKGDKLIRTYYDS